MITHLSQFNAPRYVNFVNIDVPVTPAAELEKTIITTSFALNVTPNSILTRLRAERTIKREQVAEHPSNLDLRVELAIIETSLFNARRCYHTHLALRKIV